jgi:hypothetical protein
MDALVAAASSLFPLKKSRLRNTESLWPSFWMAYFGCILAACLPFGPCFTSKLTFWFSCSYLTFCLNLGEVRKQVLATVVRRNKSKAFHIVEPFTVPVGIWLRSSHCWHNATIVRCAFKIYDGWYCQEPRGFRQFRPYPVRHPPRLSGQYWAYRYPEK